VGVGIPLKPETLAVRGTGCVTEKLKPVTVMATVGGSLEPTVTPTVADAEALE